MVTVTSALTFMVTVVDTVTLTFAVTVTITISVKGSNNVTE